ncbi:hypothetical protein AB0M29_44590 [Streptomyces sp. NPDC051976]|uniref:hypothetical protein n=1 Tax=Streptomyces sp. NPDC051976 TaxID=3154947 RepID=UPI00341E3DAF
MADTPIHLRCLIALRAFLRVERVDSLTTHRTMYRQRGVGGGLAAIWDVEFKPMA